MVPIDTINATNEVDLVDSCNCWSTCCPQKKEKDKVLDEKIKRIVMEELAKKTPQ